MGRLHAVVTHHAARCMQAAFISSYLHSSLIYVTAILFSYTVYIAADKPLGSIDEVWANLNARSAVRPYFLWINMLNTFPAHDRRL